MTSHHLSCGIALHSNFDMQLKSRFRCTTLLQWVTACRHFEASFDVIFKCRHVEEEFYPWRWGQHVASKRRQPVTYRRNFVSCKMKYLVYFNLNYAVMRLAEALRYKPKGLRFDSRLGVWDFSFASSFRPQYGPEFESSRNRNEFFSGAGRGGKGRRCLGLTTLHVWKSGGPQLSGSLAGAGIALALQSTFSHLIFLKSVLALRVHLNIKTGLYI